MSTETAKFEAVDLEIQHLRDLIETAQRHQRVLEQQVAKFGDLHVPSYLIIELDDTKNKITLNKNKMEELKNSLAPQLEEKINQLTAYVLSMDIGIDYLEKLKSYDFIASSMREHSDKYLKTKKDEIDRLNIKFPLVMIMLSSPLLSVGNNSVHRYSEALARELKKELSTLTKQKTNLLKDLNILESIFARLQSS